MSKLSNIALRKIAAGIFDSTTTESSAKAPTTEEIEKARLERRRRLAKRRAEADSDYIIRYIKELKGVPADIKNYLISKAKDSKDFALKLTQASKKAGGSALKFIKTVAADIDNTWDAYTDPSSGTYDSRPSYDVRRFYEQARQNRIDEADAAANERLAVKERDARLAADADEQALRYALEPGDIRRDEESDLPYPEDYSKQDAEESRKAVSYEQRLADEAEFNRVENLRKTIFGRQPITGMKSPANALLSYVRQRLAEGQRPDDGQRLAEAIRMDKLRNTVFGQHPLIGMKSPANMLLSDIKAANNGSTTTTAGTNKPADNKPADNKPTDKKTTNKKSTNKLTAAEDALWSYGGATAGGGALGALLGGEGNRLKGALIGALLANAANFGRRKWKYGNDVTV